MNNIAVCTIYANRQQHLQNLVLSLERSQFTPKQLVVVCMNDRLPELPATSFPINTATIDTSNGRLPLAAARNQAAEIATADKLIFLDVDCIGDRNLIDNFNYHLDREDALYSGSVRYLNRDWHQDNWTKKILNQQSALHELQGQPVRGTDKVAHPYEMFWSLCFGIRKQTFTRLGGFDPSYTGYGAEDTDFSFQARSHGTPLYKISALAYHQFHPSYAPPLNHLAEIVDNARVFADKWHIFPMTKWLHQFVDMGYLTWQGDCLEIIKLPSKAEIAACMKDRKSSSR